MALHQSIAGIRAGSEVMGDLKTVLVANRGEIAIRVIRTAHELSMNTVSIYSYEDRLSMHRYKADEAYQIGAKGQYSPVKAYLAIDEIVKIAKEHNVHMIHPGYGFLSENAEFARKVEEAGIAFIGPPPNVIEALGDKTKAREIAISCNVPVVPGTPGPITEVAQVQEFVQEHGFPIIIKAAMGGGGRGMRVVRDHKSLKDAFERAQSEALSAFGDATVFVERFLERPRHIEVQLLADSAGNVIHLYERDCSVQRRHQKVVEIAPAKGLAPHIRDAILADAIKIAKKVKYRNAGTAEFLVDQEGRHYFIEVNPRIQVEHTITEEITGIDIVAAQIQIAAGVLLPDMGLSENAISVRGFAIQCRITTEDPSQGFRPDTGKIEVYRSSGGNGVRLDGGPGYAGAVISPHYDSLLVKCTCSGASYEVARRKVLRALVEFRIRGVKTNIPFLTCLLTHPTFIEGTTWTTFIDDTPDLFRLLISQNRAQKILSYLGDVIVNGSSIKGQIGEPSLKTELMVPKIRNPENPRQSFDHNLPYTKGWRNILVEQGPEAFVKAIRKHPGTLIMDTTWRDAHQSLLATRVRTLDLVNVAPQTSVALANAFALEMWGGATFDVAMRFLYEDPWERLRKLRKLVPNIPFQMLLRGANGVGYTSYPDNAVYDFVKLAKDNGVDIFRVFDSLNFIDNMRLGIDAVQKAGGVIEAAICYTGDITDPTKKKFTLDYYIKFAQELVDCGIHILAIKDMVGLLKPEAATMLVGALRKRFPDIPIHVHTHDTPGTGVASMIACAKAGADVVDVAIDAMSGATSQPCMGAVCGALEPTPLNTGINSEDILALNAYWEQARLLYSCFEAPNRSSDTSAYQHEIPGGQYSNLLFQAQQLGLGTQWNNIKTAYIQANLLCGDIVKVTPSSKVVGDLAQFMVQNKLDYDAVVANAKKLDFPKSVVEYFQGYLGQPYGGFPEPLRTHIIKGAKRIEGRPGADLAPLDLKKLKEELTAKYGKDVKETDIASYYMYPKVFEDFQAFIAKYGDVSLIPTRYFLAKPEVNEEMNIPLEEGKTLVVTLLAVGPLNSSNGQRQVYFELNGESRAVSIEDRSAAVEHVKRERADPSKPGDIGAPMSGVIVEMRVKEGATVKDGDPICVLSAMKMETLVTTPVSGKIHLVAVKESESINAGDLVVRVAHG